MTTPISPSFPRRSGCFSHFHPVSRTVLALILAAGLTTLPLTAEAGQTVTIDDDVADSVYGNGDAADNGAAPGNDPHNLVNDPNANTVYSGGHQLDGSVFGGYANAGAGNADGNKVLLIDTEVGVDIFGGYSVESDADNNGVVISGGSILGNSSGTVHGGMAGGSAKKQLGRSFRRSRGI
ncbi:MAG: hypothetical protein LBR29_00130 [Methylobacteriaceae bacterium]|jgi:hypothetical protein|nr:hypothetical protein [Methylobacteriaceae bacterium]